MRRLRRTRRPLVALVALLAALAIGYGIRAAGSGSSGQHATPGASASAPVALSSLPPQAAQTVALIDRGGPFPYPRNDGVVFHNDEHHLPREPDGYYREYTVPTPGSPDRGARRLVRGQDGRFWYTGDHYASFQEVDVRR
ncbi:ribonuclease domain-containing protein [uncultured Jatrophihabitans sp.]|uniref:ribonuclease domain-containing protein n=1 Tax=uncultured Jatrophihabitans sp. TaxID=1610747 RepID=UPI0035CBFBD7